MTNDESEMRSAMQELEATRDDYDDGDGRCVGLVVMAWIAVIAIVGVVAWSCWFGGA